MQLSIRGLAAAGAIVWGGMFLLVGLANVIAPSYGGALLELGASLYPGYAGPAGIGSVITVTLYALLDGAIAGAALAWLYNAFARRPATA